MVLCVEFRRCFPLHLNFFCFREIRSTRDQLRTFSTGLISKNSFVSFFALRFSDIWTMEKHGFQLFDSVLKISSWLSAALKYEQSAKRERTQILSRRHVLAFSDSKPDWSSFQGKGVVSILTSINFTLSAEFMRIEFILSHETSRQ